MKIAVIGATGRTGLPLRERALGRGHEVVAHTRSPEKPPECDRLSVVEGDAYTGSGIVRTVSGVDAVVSALGQGADSPDDLLTVAGDHILGTVEETGIGRLVVLVGAGVRQEGDPEGTYRVGDVVLGVDAVDRADVAACPLDPAENGDYLRELPKAGPK